MTTEQFTLLKAEALPDIIADLEAAVAADTATAAAAASTATAARVSAETDAAIASAAAVDAEAAKDAAEAFAATAATGAGYYDTIALGRAAVADGATFGVKAGGSDGLTSPTLYRRDSSSTQTELVALAGTALVGAVESSLQAEILSTFLSALSSAGDRALTTGRLFEWADTAGRVVAWMDVDGHLWVKGVNVSQAVALQPSAENENLDLDIYVWMDASGRAVARIDRAGSLWVGTENLSGLVSAASETLDRIDIDLSGDVFRWLDSAGRLVARLDGGGHFWTGSLDVTAAISAGAQESAAIRNGHRLRESRRLLRALAEGESVSFVIAAIGDSWTDARHYWVADLLSYLQGAAGDGGTGFVSALTQSAGVGLVVRGAGWLGTSANMVAPDTIIPVPSLSQISAATAGTSLTLTASGESVAVCFPGGGGAVRYRYGSDAWTDLSLSGSGTQVVSMASPPAGEWTLTIEVTTAPVVLYGFFVANAAGVRLHKFARSASRTLDQVQQPEADWQQAFLHDPADLVIVQHGVNDRSSYSAADFEEHLRELLRRIRVGRPWADILVASPPATLQDGTSDRFMADFTAVAKRLADEFEAAHLDMQPLYGDVLADYAPAGREYFSAEDIAHPNAKGRQVLRAAYTTLFKPLL